MLTLEGALARSAIVVFDLLLIPHKIVPVICATTMVLPPAKDVYKVVVCLPPDFAGIVYYKIIAKWDSDRGDVYGSRVW